MATAPSVVTNGPAADSSLLKDWKWLTTHLVLVGVLGVFLAGGVYGVNNIIERHDLARAAADAKVLAVAQQQNVTLLQTLQADEAASAARDAQATATINTLFAQVNARDAQLKQTLSQNATLTAAQSAARLTVQTGVAPGQITAVGNTVVADLPTAIKFVNAFDQLAAAQGDLLAKQGIIDATNVKLADSNKQLADANGVIASDKTVLAATVKQCTDDKATIKAKERKHHVIIGVIMFIGGIVAGHELHI